jgi:hypothetical protein
MHSSLKSAAGILGLVCAGHAGVLFTQSMQDLEGSQPASTNIIHVDKDKVRIDPADNPGAYMIYRGDKGVLWAVDLKQKTYTETTGKDFEAMAAKRDAAVEKIKAQMQLMPDDQKQMMQALLAKLGVEDGPKTEYKKEGAAEKLGAWPAEKYAGTRAGDTISEIWLTAPANVGLGATEIQALKDMARLFGKFAKNLSGLVGSKEDGLDGLPVKTVAYRGGKAFWQSELKEVKQEELSAALFELPAGLTQKKLGG